MDAMGMEEPPTLYTLDIDMELDVMPIDLLATLLRDSILEDRYEDAEDVVEIIKNRNYSVEITEKMLTLKYNKAE